MADIFVSGSTGALKLDSASQMAESLRQVYCVAPVAGVSLQFGSNFAANQENRGKKRWL
jgi:hypothetical protein